MKTSIKSLIAIGLTTLTLSTTAAVASNEVTLLKEIKNINKINVSGNVELILVQSNTESVQVYNNYYANNALVQSKEGNLNISSYSKEKLTVVVNFKNLTNITASDNATIASFGKVSLLGLELNLKNNAQANLDLNAINLYTQINGNSALTLTGTAMNYKANVQNLASVNLNKFSADATAFESRNSRIAKNTNVDEEFTINLGK